MKRFSTKILSVTAMLVALQIVLSKFLMLQLTDSIRLSIDSVPILLAGVWFGPVAGGVVGALSDFLGTILFPTAGAYYPPLTAAFLLVGAISGALSLALKNRPPILRAVVCVLPAEIVGSWIAKSLALSSLVGVPFFSLLAARALPVFAVTAVNTALVFVLDRLLGGRARALLPKAVRKTDAGGVSSPVSESETFNYEQALEYIHRVAWRGSRLGLDRTKELLSSIGNPHHALKFIHIAGTNGKGSTAAMLARILTDSGYRTGLYISPFINRFNERMQVDGEPIGDEELAGIVSYVRPYAEAMADHPTEFELITVVGFEFFLRRNVDIVVLEVGMGGELDSTNVIDAPELAIITNIGLDHTRELGPTITDIARAKAGIIKPGGDVLIYDQNSEADAVFEEACRLRGARLTVADHGRIRNVSPSLDALRFTCEPYGELVCGLVGSYQAQNASVVLAAVELLQKKGWRIPLGAIRTGLANVRWPARFEVLRREPAFIADGGHNPQGVTAAAESLKAHFPDRKIVFLLGVMADKDIPHMIDQIGPIAQEFVTVTPNNPRALPADALKDLLRERGFAATACGSVEESVRVALAKAGEHGIVCALGSLYLLGDVRNALGIR